MTYSASDADLFDRVVLIMPPRSVATPSSWPITAQGALEAFYTRRRLGTGIAGTELLPPPSCTTAPGVLRPDACL